MEGLKLLNYFFSAFAGIYALAALIFFMVYKTTRVKHGKYYFSLAVLILLYLLSCLLFTHDIAISVKTGLLFPLQCVFGAASFLIYFKILTNRFFLRGFFQGSVKICLSILAVLAAMASLRYFLGFNEVLFAPGSSSENAFLAHTIGKFEPSALSKTYLFLASTIVFSGNIYLLVKLGAMQLKGYHKLIYFGIVSGLFVNLNDNLMGTGFVEWLFPAMFLGYIFEMVYFLLLSLRSYIKQNELMTNHFVVNSGDEIFGDGFGDVQKNDGKEVEQPARAPLVSVLKSLKETYSHLDVSAEINVSNSFKIRRSKADMALIFYNTLLLLFENINNSPKKTAKLAVAAQLNGEKYVTFIESSPRNYPLTSKDGQTRKNLIEFLQLKRLLSDLDAQIVYEPAMDKNVYKLFLE